MTPQAQPPRPGVAVRLALRTLLSEAERRQVLSELSELWERRRMRDGAAVADRWYRRQLARYPLRLLRERVRRPMRDAVPVAGSGGERADMFSGLRADVVPALRSFVRTPALALTVVLTVGLGMGGTTVMLAVVRAVLLRPLPYARADRLVRIYHAVQGNRFPLSVVGYQAIEAQQTRFDSVAAWTNREFTWSGRDASERVRAKAVTAGYFPLLGVTPALGRTFRNDETAPGGPRRVLLSHGFWQRALGGAPDVIGRSIRLDGEDYAVIGVLPRNAGPLDASFDVFPALQLQPPARRGPFFLTVVARLRPGINVPAAQVELRAIDRHIFMQWKGSWQDSTSTFGIMGLDTFVVGRYRARLYILLGAALFVLLMASANAAALLVARTAQRQTELAARAALGASRARLTRLLITESSVLGLTGAALGLGLAGGALRWLQHLPPNVLPRAGEIALDATVPGSAALLALGSILLFGVLPALERHGPGGPIAQTLRAGARGSGTRSAHNTRSLLAGAQFAVAVPLLAGAGLLLNSFMRLASVDPGFATDHLLTLALPRAGSRYASADSGAFHRELIERVRALPGVLSAGVNNGRPPAEATDINNFELLDQPVPPGAAQPVATWLVASPGYFEALHIPLIAGRMFNAHDTRGVTTAVLVDQTWARHFYPRGSPIGKRLYEGGCNQPDCDVPTIVGVVGDIRFNGLDNAQNSVTGTIYVPESQWLPGSTYLFVRTAGDPLALLQAVRGVVHELDSSVPIVDVATGDELIRRALAAPRNLTAAVAAFSTVALLLAVIGIYGTMAGYVAERRRDIGIRMALGGRPNSVLGLVLARGMAPVLAGAGLGMLLALALTRFLSGMLYDVHARDPLTFLAIVAMLVVTAAAACLIPASRAARLDPVQTLRSD